MVRGFVTATWGWVLGPALSGVWGQEIENAVIGLEALFGFVFGILGICCVPSARQVGCGS